MATDLFGTYYNNPQKSSIYTNITCNGDSADEMSFDINGGAGEISTNSEVLASVDLSDVHVGMSQYTNNMRIIEPNGYCYIRGMLFGDSYTSKSFGRVYAEITERDDWMQKSIMFFVIKYTDVNTGQKVIESLKVSGSVEEEATFIDVCNAYFEEKAIPITVSYDDGYVVFTSTQLDWEFWVDHVLLWDSATDVDIFSLVDKWIKDNGHNYDFGWDDNYASINNVNVSNPIIENNVYSSIIVKSDYSRLYNLMNCLDKDFDTILEENDVKKVHLYEDITRYVPPRRYRNGAMLGCLLKVTYPQYNDENITDTQRALKVAHIADRVQEFYAIPESLFDGTFTSVRKLIDVVDDYHSEYDSELYNKWMGYYSHINGGDKWIDSDEVPQVVPDLLTKWENSKVSTSEQAKSIYKDIETRDAMGIKGYCAYLFKTNNWMTMGQLYARTSVYDDTNYPDVRNLIPSIIVYNPNKFPVTLNYMTFG